jgi:Flp pilus assembly protein TadB
LANGAGDLWSLLTVVGVIILGCAIAYAMLRSRKMTRNEKAVSERATENVYAQEARDPANRS